MRVIADDRHDGGAIRPLGGLDEEAFFFRGSGPGVNELPIRLGKRVKQASWTDRNDWHLLRRPADLGIPADVARRCTSSTKTLTALDSTLESPSGTTTTA